MPTSSSSKATKPKRSRTASAATNNSRTLEKTEITINVYDLLPPGRLSNLLWTFGSGLLHSGVVVATRNREYAYGGHNRKGVTGVYYTKPQFTPPGGTFRCSILQGFTLASKTEIDRVVKEVSEEFLGERYNLLTNNCNHFTSALCERLTGKAAPSWLNRAAGIGVALPCVVPKEWISPPEPEDMEGEAELLEEADGEEVAMLAGEQRRRQREASAMGNLEDVDAGGGAEEGSSLAGGKKITSTDEEPPPRLVPMPATPRLTPVRDSKVKDTSGRDLPVAERAPVPVVVSKKP